MKTLKEWAKAHGVAFVGRSAGVYTTGTVSAGALEEIFAEAADLRRERDELAARTRELTLYAAGVEAERNELAARLAKIEAQETVAWLETDKRGGRMLFGHDSPYPNSVDEYFCVVKTELIARPAPAAAPERAEPDHLEGARGMVCRCGPDGCSDRVSCPRGER